MTAQTHTHEDSTETNSVEPKITKHGSKETVGVKNWDDQEEIIKDQERENQLLEGTKGNETGHYPTDSNNPTQYLHLNHTNKG